MSGVTVSSTSMLTDTNITLMTTTAAALSALAAPLSSVTIREMVTLPAVSGAVQVAMAMSSLVIVLPLLAVQS